MGDHSELKRLAEAATQGPWGYDGSYVCPARVEDGTTYVESWRSVADCAQPENTKFIAAANPAAVLELLDNLESAQKKIDQAWNRSNPALDGYIPGALDAWKRPVKQHLPYDFSGNPSASAIQYCNGWNDSGGYWKNHCSDLQAQIAGLRTGYEAYERVNAELKAEVEGLRKDAERYRVINGCPIRTMVALGRKAHDVDFDLSQECDRFIAKRAALGQGERS